MGGSCKEYAFLCETRAAGHYKLFARAMRRHAKSNTDANLLPMQLVLLQCWKLA